MELVLISWNIRGLNNAIAKRSVRELMDLHKVNIMCIQETKIECWSDRISSKVWDEDLYSWIGQGSIGQSGGLVSIWDQSFFKCISFAQDHSWIWTVLESLQDKRRINVINVYAP